MKTICSVVATACLLKKQAGNSLPDKSTGLFVNKKIRGVAGQGKSAEFSLKCITNMYILHHVFGSTGNFQTSCVCSPNLSTLSQVAI